jgi:short-subunit dehydrogenase
MQGFYDSLRMELYRHGVSVTVVCPWWVATEFHAAQLNKDGVSRGAERGTDMYTAKTMSAERCAEITLRAAYSRRREVLMGPGMLAVWLKVIAPGFLDWLAVKVFLEPAIRRASAARAHDETKTPSGG